MKSENRSVLLSVILLVAASLACSSLSAPPTSAPVPTHTAVPTQTSAPVNTPITVDLGVSGQERLEEAPYTHPSQALSFNPPKDWTIEDTTYDVYIHSPQSVFFYAAVTNTGHELDKDSFANYIANAEDNYYTFEDNYKETDRQVNESINLVLIEKTYMYQGTPTFARSMYQQFGQSVYVVEMIGDDAEIKTDPNYDLIFSAFYKTVNVDSVIAATLPVYEARWTFHSPSETYRINVPIGWAHNNYDVSGSDQIQDELISPDNNAVIQIFALDDSSTKRNLSDLHDTTLQLLNSAYGNNDVKILDQDEQDGRLLLEWTSEGKVVNGYAYIAADKNTTESFMFIILWNKAFEDVYRQTAIDILSTFNKK